jgi:hypothetical protein
MDKPRLSSKKKRGRSKSKARAEKSQKSQSQTQSQKLVVNIGRNVTQRKTRSSGGSMTPAPHSQNLVPFHIQTAPAQQPLVDYDRIARMTGALQEQNVPNRSIPLQEHVPVSVPVPNVEPRRDGPTSAGFELTPSEARVKQEPVVVPKPIVEALGKSRDIEPSKPKDPLKEKIERKLMKGQDFPAPGVAVSKPVHVAPPVKQSPPTQALLEAREAITMVKKAFSPPSVTASLSATSGETTLGTTSAETSSIGTLENPEQDLTGTLKRFPEDVKPIPKEKKGVGRPKGAKNKPKPIKT